MIVKRNAFVLQAVLLIGVFSGIARSEDWKHEIAFPADAYCSEPSAAGESAWYVPVGHSAGPNVDINRALDGLKPILENPDILH